MKLFLVLCLTSGLLLSATNANTIDKLRGYAEAVAQSLEQDVSKRVTRDAPAPATVQNLTELNAAFNALCQEIYHLSRHVVFHEHALRHIALASHHKQGHQEDNQTHSHNHGSDNSTDAHEHHEHGHETHLSHAAESNSTSDDHHHHVHANGHEHHHHDHHEAAAAPATRRRRQAIAEGVGIPITRLDAGHDEHHNHAAEGNSHHAEEAHDHHGHHNDHADETHGCNTENVKWRCSLLHQHTCHTGHHEDSTKTFAEQYQEWFAGLINHKHSPSLNVTTEAAGAHHHGFHHHHEQAKNDHHGEHEAPNHEGHAHENTVEGEQSPGHEGHADEHHHHDGSHAHGHQHQLMVQPNDRVLDEMEEALYEVMVFATCEVLPNRHISLILQEDVRGRINLWQRKSGNGPVGVHVKLSGFRVPTGTRHTRESIIIPVELPLDENVQNASQAIPPEHGFHVHVLGNLSRDCQHTGPHYNPTNSSHGGPLDAVRHVGDLGNIRCDKNGKVDAEYTYPKISLSGAHSILGRSIVIHSDADDYGRNADNPASISSGNSGAKIACCRIEEVDRLPGEDDDTVSLIVPIRASQEGLINSYVANDTENNY